MYSRGTDEAVGPDSAAAPDLHGGDAQGVTQGLANLIGYRPSSPGVEQWRWEWGAAASSRGLPARRLGCGQGGFGLGTKQRPATAGRGEGRRRGGSSSWGPGLPRYAMFRHLGFKTENGLKNKKTTS